MYTNNSVYEYLSEAKGSEYIHHLRLVMKKILDLDHLHGNLNPN